MADNANPSRPVRARGLKPIVNCAQLLNCWSRPVRARGLKHTPVAAAHRPKMTSRPVRARGLKQEESAFNDWSSLVAPRTGAWIETPGCPVSEGASSSRPVRARGLKLAHFGRVHALRSGRAPYGARGLKHRRLLHRRPARHVVPRNPASISTRHWRGLGNAITRRITPEGGE